MSEAQEGAPSLPPAAFEITRYRRAMELAALRPRIVPILLIVFVVAAAAFIVGLVVLGMRAVVDVPSLLGLGVAGTGVLLALLVVTPSHLAAQRRREHGREAAVFRMAAASGLSEHLASIGYAAPVLVTGEWVDDPHSTATVPLVHDSVIAARWWIPTANDTRVFVEPYLLQGETRSSLPALPPLTR